MKYAFFPGCSMESTAEDFKMSTLAVAKALGIELEEILPVFRESCSRNEQGVQR